jgi:hypothetical protein
MFANEVMCYFIEFPGLPVALIRGDSCVGYIQYDLSGKRSALSSDHLLRKTILLEERMRRNVPLWHQMTYLT